MEVVYQELRRRTAAYLAPSYTDALEVNINA